MPQGNQGIGIDTISSVGGSLRASGDVAMRLLQANFNVNALRTNDILRKDEWKLFDQAIVEVARKRLVGVGALMSRGLTFNVNNALGTTQIEWERVSDMTPAEVSMSGVTDGQRDRLVFDLQTMPLPIIHKDFQLNIRHLSASRTRGQPIDTMQAELCARIVSEKIEEILFKGLSMSVLGSSIAGLTTESNRNTGTLAASWELPATPGTSKVDDVIAMIDAAISDNMYGPYGLFVTQKAYTLLADDYKAESDITQLNRLLQIPGIEFILPSKDLAPDNIVLVQLSRDVVEIVNGMQPTLVQWESHGGMQFNFKVMAIMVPRVRSTQTNQSGIVHYTV